MATTLTALTTLAQQRADMVPPDNFVSSAEWTAYVNDSLQELYGLVLQKFGDDYFISTTPFQFVTDGATVNYPLPNGGLFKLHGIEVQYTSNQWIPIPQFMFSERNGSNPVLTGYYAGFAIRHRLVGNSVMIVTPSGQMPAPAGYTIRMWYTPPCPALVAGGDVIPAAMDNFGWATSYISVDCAIKARVKEQSPVQQLMLEKKALIERIESEAANRNAGSAQRVPNPYAGGTWWDEDGGHW